MSADFSLLFLDLLFSVLKIYKVENALCIYIFDLLTLYFDDQVTSRTSADFHFGTVFEPLQDVLIEHLNNDHVFAGK